MGFRFVHVADVHLGAGFASRSDDLRRDLTRASREAFSAAVDLALTKRVHALLIAGDLFNDDTLSLDAERFLAAELARLTAAGITAIYVTGNHDPGAPGARTRRVAWPAGFRLIAGHDAITVDVFDAEGRRVGRVSGAGHENALDGTNLAASLPPAADPLPHVGLVHAWVRGAEASAAGQDRYAACSAPDLAGKGYAYWALGHIHKRQRVLDEPPAWYPGSPQGLDPTETGLKGGLLVELDGGAPQVAFIRLGPLRWETVRAGGLEGVRDLAAFRDAAARAVAEHAGAGAGEPGRDWIVRLVPTGPCPIAGEILAELAEDERALEFSLDLAAHLGVRAVEVRPQGLVRPVDVAALYRRGPSPLRSAIDLLRQAATDDALLESLFPETPAGFSPATGAPRAAEGPERARYLRTLLEGLEEEAAARFAAGGE